MKYFQEFNGSKFVLFTSLLFFSILYALKLDGVINWSWWSIFIPLWIWKGKSVLINIVTIQVLKFQVLNSTVHRTGTWINTTIIRGYNGHVYQVLLLLEQEWGAMCGGGDPRPDSTMRSISSTRPCWSVSQSTCCSSCLNCSLRTTWTPGDTSGSSCSSPWSWSASSASPSVSGVSDTTEHSSWSCSALSTSSSSCFLLSNLTSKISLHQSLSLIDYSSVSSPGPGRSPSSLCG